MDIGERRQANILVLAPVGRIDNLTSAAFQARLLAAVTSSSADVVVDLSGVEYISSAGLRALMAASRQKPKERRLAVACLQTVVREIFAISRFSHVVPVFATVEDASTAWRAPPGPQSGTPSTAGTPDDARASVTPPPPHSSVVSDRDPAAPRAASAPHRSSAVPSPRIPPEKSSGSVISIWQTGDILIGRLHADDA